MFKENIFRIIILNNSPSSLRGKQQNKPEHNIETQNMFTFNIKKNKNERDE